MKKSVKKLAIKKMNITKLDMNKVQGGYRATALMCNTVPKNLGGLGCHMH